MAHPPYENWLFEEESLTPEQLYELSQHLGECADCRRLQTNWQAIRAHITLGGMLEPADGFPSRWRVGLAHKRQVRLQKMQSLKLLAALSIGSLLTLMVLGMLLAVSLARVDIPMAVIQALVSLAILVEDSMSLLEKIPTGLTLTAWILFSTGLVGLAVVWVCSLWKVRAGGEVRS
jgi:hypothetical protein